MDFPNAETIDEVLPPVEFPTFADVRYEPPSPEVEDVEATARAEVDRLSLGGLPEGATVAVGLGSRGIHDVVPIARATVDELRERGFDPVVVPAMGSHGGATVEGQRETLAALGLTEAELGCPIDARMDTETVGETAFGAPVHLATAVLEANAVAVVNRVKPHTNFEGHIESGLCKMIAIGLGKQAGAQEAHRQALVHGYVPVIESAFERIREATTLLGGIAIVENFYDRTAIVEGVPAADLPDRESQLLERAREHMPTLPYDDLDVLVVERIGKDVSGAGMDTNVIGRYRVLNAEEPDSPDIRRIVALGLTEATHGNGQGIGLADLTTTEVTEALDLKQVYANALTSSSLSKARLPVALPTEEQTLTAAVSTIGPYDPETVRLAWIRDTAHLSEFRVSEALADEGRDHLAVTGRSTLEFDGGTARFESV